MKKETLEEIIDDVVSLELLKANLDTQREQILNQIDLKKSAIRAFARQRPTTSSKSAPAMRAAKAPKGKAVKKPSKVKAKSGKRGADIENLLNILRVQGEPQSVADIREIFDAPGLSQKLHTLTSRGEVKKVGKMGSYKYMYNSRNGVAPAAAAA